MSMYTKTSYEVNKEISEIAKDRVSYYWDGVGMKEDGEENSKIPSPTLQVFLTDNKNRIIEKTNTLRKTLGKFNLNLGIGNLGVDWELMDRLYDGENAYYRITVGVFPDINTSEELELIVELLSVYGSHIDNGGKN